MEAGYSVACKKRIKFFLAAWVHKRSLRGSVPEAQKGLVRHLFLLHRFSEVAGGNAFEVQPGNQLLDCLATAEVGGQHAGGKVNSVVGIASIIPDASLPDFDGSGPGEDFPGREAAVLDDEPPILFVSAMPVVLKECLDFLIDGFLEHSSGSFTYEFIEGRAVVELLPEGDDFGIELQIGWRGGSVFFSLVHGVSFCPRRAAEVVIILSRMRHLSKTGQYTACMEVISPHFHAQAPSICALFQTSLARIGRSHL